MKVTIGNDGTVNTWQDDFQTTIHCECGSEAHLAFVAIEEEGGVCDLYKNGQGGFWPHDAIAVAIYFCRKCAKPIAKYNQA